MKVCEICSEEIGTKDGDNRCEVCERKDRKRVTHNAARRQREAILRSLGLVKVRGALGGIHLIPFQQSIGLFQQQLGLPLPHAGDVATRLLRLLGELLHLLRDPAMQRAREWSARESRAIRVTEVVAHERRNPKLTVNERGRWQENIQIG